MKNTPLVSVIIPAYNADKYIADAIESILNQTYKNIEVIVVDDHSTDSTLAIVNAIAKNDNRIHVFANKENLGVGANREVGIAMSRGVYICWQDADDISMRDRIALQVEFMEARPKVGIVGGFITFFDEQGSGLTRTYDETDDKLRRSIFRYNPVAQPACMVRRECFTEVGGYDASYRVSEDLEMQFRIGEKYEFGNVQKVVIRYRQTAGSLTASNLKMMEKATLAIREKYRKSPAYQYGLGDFLFNMAQRFSMNMPYSLRTRIFRLIRGDS